MPRIYAIILLAIGGWVLTIAGLWLIFGLVMGQ